VAAGYVLETHGIDSKNYPRGWTVQVSNPDRNGRFFCPPKRPDRSCGSNQSPVQLILLRSHHQSRVESSRVERDFRLSGGAHQPSRVEWDFRLSGGAHKPSRVEWDFRFSGGAHKPSRVEWDFRLSGGAHQPSRVEWDFRLSGGSHQPCRVEWDFRLSGGAHQPSRVQGLVNAAGF
jgi:hypothetical protein